MNNGDLRLEGNNTRRSVNIITGPAKALSHRSPARPANPGAFLVFPGLLYNSFRSLDLKLDLQTSNRGCILWHVLLNACSAVQTPDTPEPLSLAPRAEQPRPGQQCYFLPLDM